MSTITAFPSTSIIDSGAAGRSVLQTVTLNDTRTLLNITGTAATWTAKQQWQCDDAVDDYLIALEPDVDDTQSAQFGLTGSSFDFSGTKDFVARLGHNISSGGGARDAARPMLAVEWEQNYFFSGQQYSEWHVVHRSPVAAFNQRLLSGFLSNTQAWTKDNNQLQIAVGRVFHRDPTAVTDYWKSDGTDGFRTINQPIGTEHTNTSARHLQLSGPTGMTSGTRFMKVLKNSAEIMFMTRFGEVTLNGSVSDAGAGENNAMLEVDGRDGTNSVVRFRNSAGTSRLAIANTAGAFAVIQFAGQFQQSGPFQIFDTNGSTQRFRVNEAGQVATDQVTAASALGSINGVWPIRNIAGTIIGYMPTYASFTP